MGGDDIPVLDVHQSLGVGISQITLMGWAEMQLGLIEGILHLVRKYTRRKTRDEFLDPEQVGMVQDVVVDEQIVSKEVQLGPGQPHTTNASGAPLRAYPVFEMLEETTDDSGEVDDVCRFVFFKNLARLCRVSVGVKRQMRGALQVERRLFFTSDRHPPSEGRSMSRQASSRTSSPPLMIRQRVGWLVQRDLSLQ